MVINNITGHVNYIPMAPAFQQPVNQPVNIDNRIRYTAAQMFVMRDAMQDTPPLPDIPEEIRANADEESNGEIMNYDRSAGG